MEKIEFCSLQETSFSAFSATCQEIQIFC